MKDPFGSSLFVSSSNVEIRPLQRAFHKTTASYKFLWLLVILDLVKEASHDAGPLRLSISRICARMVAKSWIPTQRFKLSFGRWDQITTIIESLKIRRMIFLLTRGTKNRKLYVCWKILQSHSRKNSGRLFFRP